MAKKAAKSRGSARSSGRTPTSSGGAWRVAVWLVLVALAAGAGGAAWHFRERSRRLADEVRILKEKVKDQEIEILILRGGKQPPSR